MPLETASHIKDLVANNPASSDGLNQADDHIRMIKQALLNDIGSALLNKSLSVVDGTVTTPSVSFAVDPATGLYRKSGGNIGISGRMTGVGTVPIGTIIQFAGPDANIPTGYIACDGIAVGRTDYPDLFAAIGTTWGPGDGATTFNVPSLASYFTRHRDNATLAGAVGTKKTPCNLSHTHTLNANTGIESADHTHSFSGSTGGMSANAVHSHSYSYPVASGQNASINNTGSPAPLYNVGTTSTSAANIDHAHSFSGTTSYVSAYHTHAISATTSAGSADGDEVRPYSAAVLFCIRAY